MATGRAAAVDVGQRLIRISGRALDATGEPLHGGAGVLFAIYQKQFGGAPLWQEAQTVEAGEAGGFSALLGAASEAGVPAELFAAAEPRWLAVQFVTPGAQEQPRVLLTAVPYAAHAADSERLGGLPASAFLQRAETTAAADGAAPRAHAPQAATGVTSGYLPVFADASGSLTNSILTQSSSNVGLGISAPTARLHIQGSNPTLRVDNFSTTVGDSPNFNFYSGRGSATSPAATQSGDNLGQFAAAGYNGSAFPGSKVKVSFLATENWNTTANGTAMSFATTANGSSTRTERMRIDNSGNIGIGSSAPTHTLGFGGAQPNSIGVEANPSSGGAGMALSISAGTPAAGASNQSGGNLLLVAGSGSGSAGGGALRLQTSGDASSATAAGTTTDRLLIMGEPRHMGSTGVNLFSVHVAPGEAAGGRVKYTVVASDGTNYAAETGEIIYLATPKGMWCQRVISQVSAVPISYSNTVLSTPAVGQPGALNVNCVPGYSGSDPGFALADTPPTAFTATSHKLYFTIENQSQAALTLQQ